jgi:hypothetical protein
LRSMPILGTARPEVWRIKDKRTFDQSKDRHTHVVIICKASIPAQLLPRCHNQLR